MGKVMKALKTVVGGVVVLAVAYILLRGLASWSQGYSWEEMDWQQRGSTSIADFLAASDIGRREVMVNGTSCIEYYAYKDGIPVKTVCPRNKRDAPALSSAGAKP